MVFDNILINLIVNLKMFVSVIRRLKCLLTCSRPSSVSSQDPSDSLEKATLDGLDFLIS